MTVAGSSGIGEEVLEECRWPALDARYDAALREAVRYILSRWWPVGIIASGTIIRGNPAPNSDLDLYVIEEGRMRERVQRFFAGVPAEIFVNPPDRIGGYFESDKRAGRLITAHLIATGFVVYEQGPVVQELKALAAEELAATPEPSSDFLLRRRYAVATWLEDAEDMLAVDPEMCSMLASRAVEAALEYRFWETGRWQPRSKDTLSAMEELDPEVASDARAFYRAAGAEARLRLARVVVLQAVGADRFFEWESGQEWVPRDHRFAKRLGRRWP